MDFDDLIRNSSFIRLYVDSARQAFSIKELLPQTLGQYATRAATFDPNMLRQINSLQRLADEQRAVQKAAQSALLPDVSALNALSRSVLEDASAANEFLRMQRVAADPALKQMSEILDDATTANWSLDQSLESVLSQAASSADIAEAFVQQQARQATLIKEELWSNYLSSTAELADSLIAQHGAIRDAIDFLRNDLIAADAFSADIKRIYSSLDEVANRFDWQREELEDFFEQLAHEYLGEDGRAPEINDGKLLALLVHLAGTGIVFAWQLLKEEHSILVTLFFAFLSAQQLQDHEESAEQRFRELKEQLTRIEARTDQCMPTMLRFYVVRKSAVFANPDVTADSEEFLQKGTVVQLLQQRVDWAQIQYYSKDKTGIRSGWIPWDDLAPEVIERPTKGTEDD